MTRLVCELVTQETSDTKKKSKKSRARTKPPERKVRVHPLVTVQNLLVTLRGRQPKPLRDKKKMRNTPAVMKGKTAKQEEEWEST